MKGIAIADHLAYCSPEKTEEIQGDFPDEDIIGIKVNHRGCTLIKQRINIGVVLEFS